MCIVGLKTCNTKKNTHKTDVFSDKVFAIRPSLSFYSSYRLNNKEAEQKSLCGGVNLFLRQVKPGL